MRSTSATLIGRLRDLSDAEAWSAFVQAYSPRLQAWCKKSNLSKEDADIALTMIDATLPR